MKNTSLVEKECIALRRAISLLLQKKEMTFREWIVDAANHASDPNEDFFDAKKFVESLAETLIFLGDSGFVGFSQEIRSKEDWSTAVVSSTRKLWKLCNNER